MVFTNVLSLICLDHEWLTPYSKMKINLAAKVRIRTKLITKVWSISNKPQELLKDSIIVHGQTKHVAILITIDAPDPTSSIKWLMARIVMSDDRPILEKCTRKLRWPTPTRLNLNSNYDVTPSTTKPELRLRARAYYVIVGCSIMIFWTWATSGRLWVRVDARRSLRQSMSSVKESLLGDQSEHSGYRTINKETVVAVESAQIVGRDGAHNGPGSGSVSFHNVSYEVNSCFGRKRKVILNSVR